LQAYEYWARNASPDVGDVSVTSPDAGNITIYVLKKDGVIPVTGDAVLDSVNSACNDKSRRPLTDNVTVLPASAKNTTISVEYYISPDNSVNATMIEAAVTNAVNDYKAWQTTKIGRTINPDELRKLMLNAGASRVDIITPERAAVLINEVAQITTPTITYKGLGE
jgi:phage-related baseplate assembly protein